MKEMIDIFDKYGFKAPLIQIVNNEDLEGIKIKCIDNNFTLSIVKLVEDVFELCKQYEKSIISLDALAEKTNRRTSTIRSQIKKLQTIGCVEQEFITTDKIRKRRGSLFKITINENVAKVIPPSHIQYQTISMEEIKKIDSPVYHSNTRTFTTLLSLTLLAKAMRTNRKDNRSKVDVRFLYKKKEYRITTEGVGNKIAEVQSLSYYIALVTWLKDALNIYQNNNVSLTETYDIPIDDIIILSKKYSKDKVSAYRKQCILNLERLSGTRFNLTKIPIDIVHGLEESESDILFYSFFRLDAIFNIETPEGRKQYARIQFPKSLIDTLLMNQGNSLIELTNAIALKSDNEIEILYFLWIRQFKNISLIRGFYSWEQIRKEIAPQTELPEFKIKFSKMFLKHRDEKFEPEIIEDDKTEYSKLNGAFILGSEGGAVVAYGKAIMYGLIINIGKIDRTQSQIAFRLDPYAYRESDRYNQNQFETLTKDDLN